MSYVEPALFLESVDGLSNGYHPHGDIRNGEAFLSQIYTAITRSLYDHTSILKLIEWRHGLAPLTPRDAAANNLAEALTFDSPNLNAPQWTVPFVPVAPCILQPSATAAPAARPSARPAPAGPENAEWDSLRSAARSIGWKLAR